MGKNVRNFTVTGEKRNTQSRKDKMLKVKPKEEMVKIVKNPGRVERQVKLRNNVIIDGQMYTRGSIIAENLLPEHLRGEEYVTEDLDHRDGKVLLLTDFMYSSMAPGTTTHYPVSLEAGETINLEDIPERQRQDLIEGTHFLVQWDERDRNRVKAQKVKEFEGLIFREECYW